MAVIVEDGTGVANADSYVDIADARTYALARGIMLSADDTVLSGQVVIAADFIESFDFVGDLVSVTQAMSWPRKNVTYSDGTVFPSNAIPLQLIKAQNEAIIAIQEGVTLQPNTDPTTGGFVTMEKVGPIEVKYSERVGTTITPFLPKVMAALFGLINAFPTLRTVRV